MGLEDFEVIQTLGKGAFAHVDKVKRKADGKIYALKRVDIATIPPKDLGDALNEIRILASFKHPRLVRWYETFVEAETQELCIVMELCPYGDLDAKIKRHQHRKQYIDEREIWVYAINMLEGLSALHAKGVVHRDLKPANCLIDQHGCVKIADMNISKVAKGGNMQTQVGTPYFICPEIYQKKPYSTASDIWSLGGVLYNLAALHPPFLADNIQNLRKVVIKGTYDPLPTVYGSSITTLIGKLLQVNPADRPEAKDILKDPLVERHKYLLLHPLASGQEDAEGEIMDTIKISSDREGTKTITLPGPAYDEAGWDGGGGGGGSPRGPHTPRSPTSVFVVYSPRGKETSPRMRDTAAQPQPQQPQAPPTQSLASPSSASSPGSMLLGHDGFLAAAPPQQHPLYHPSPRGTSPPAPTSSPRQQQSHPSQPPAHITIPPPINTVAGARNGVSSPSTSPTPKPTSTGKTPSPLSSLLPAMQDKIAKLQVRTPSPATPPSTSTSGTHTHTQNHQNQEQFFDDSDAGNNIGTSGSPSSPSSATDEEGGKANKRSSIRRILEGDSKLPPMPDMKKFFSKDPNKFASGAGMGSGGGVSPSTSPKGK